MGWPLLVLLTCCVYCVLRCCRKGATESTLSVYMDPSVYGYTGGSTAVLRSKWFDPADSAFEQQNKTFMQDKGFCRCNFPYLGVPPNCIYSCGPARYRVAAEGCLDDECCFDCPEGVACELQDNELQSIVIAPGYWRVSNRSLDVRPCVGSRDSCVGGPVAGEFGIGYCKQNHRGPYCSLCIADFYREDDACKSCDDASPSAGLYALIVLAVMCAALAVLYKQSAACRALAGKLNTRSMIVKLKLAVTFFQIVLLLPVVFLVAYPTEYVNFLSVFEALNINIVEVFKLGCVPSWDFHSSVVFMCALPLCVVGLFGLIGFGASTLIADRKRRSALYGQLVSWSLLLLYCIYPSLTYFIFQVFQVSGLCTALTTPHWYGF